MGSTSNNQYMYLIINYEWSDINLYYTKELIVEWDYPYPININ
jgi:hypothetical protein